MEEDNELLDWGNEDDEHQDFLRKGSMDHDSRRGDVDEMEDAVSLGEDEDEQGYYAYQREHEDASGSLCDKDPISRPASAHNLTALSNSSDYHSSQDVTQDGSFSFHRPSSSRDSPQRHQNSKHNHSPQRSHSLAANALRLTHALPPKPVVSNVPYLPPSHPSIVEATSMISITRTAGRESKKTNGVPASAGNGKVTTSPAVDRDPSLPSEWEVRHPRSGGGVYYYNSETHQSTWSRPPSLRASRGASASQPDFDIADASKHPPTSNPLSYEDRHYRPVGSEPVPPTESRPNDRNQDPTNAHYHRQEEYAMTPPPSPTRYRERERARSLSPILAEPEPSYSRGRDRESRPGRGSQRPSRGRIATNPDSPIQQREREPPSVGPDYPERNWGRPPPIPSAEYTSKHDRSTRRPPRQRQQGDDPSYEHLADDRDRVPLRRSVSNRVSNRDREPETREHLVQNPSISTSRHRSPPHMRERDVYEPAREREPKMIEDPQTRPAHPPSSRRDKPSRFDRPVPGTTTSSATASVSSDSLPVRHRDYMPSEDVEYSHRRGGDRERERDHHRGHSHDELSRHANPQPMIPVDSVPPYSRSRHVRDYDQERMQPSADHERLSLALDQEEQSSRPKRVPLPPQEMTFRDTVTARPGPPNHDVDYHSREPPRQSFPPPAHSPTSSRNQPPRSGPPVQNNNGIPPTGPRQQPFYETSRGGRSFPPGSAGADYLGDRSRSARQHRDRGPSYGQRTGLPSVDTRIDIDREEPLSSSRYPPSPPMRSAEPASRGMYADREAANAEAPTGPRAMKHPSTSPTTPYGPLPPVGRSRERSPPPFNIPAGGDSRDGRRDYDPRADGGVAWRGERRGSGQHFPHPPPSERGYPPRRGDTRGGRPNAFSRGPPPVPVSGTNNIPIGGKRPLDGNAPPREPPPPPPMNRYNQKPGPPPPASLMPNNVGYDAHPRDFPPGKAIYERPPPNVPMIEGFRNRFEETDPPHRPDDPFPPQPYERRQAAPSPAPVLPSGPPPAPPADESKPRREARKSRFDKPAELPPRTWVPREPSPSSDMAIHASNVEKEVRVPTPPPVSREPSATSPTWDLPDRPPMSTRHSGDESKADGRSVSSRPGVVEAETRPKQPELLERFSTPPVRTGDVYNGGHPNNGPRQSHALPPNPVTHHREAHTFHQDSVPPPMGRSDSRRGHEEGRPRSRWGEPKRDGLINQQPAPEPPASHMAVDEPPVHNRTEEYTETRTSKPIRIRRPPMGSGPDVTAQTRVASVAPMDNYAPSDQIPVIYERDGYGLAKRLERPPVTRRGGSLLDRLSLDDGPPVMAASGAPPQPSLRDRVQIVPAKRDRDDMMGDYYETQFDGDDGGMDPLSKRPRQKGMKPRRGRRRGGMP